MERHITIIIALMIFKCISAEVSPSTTDNSTYKNLKNDDNRLHEEGKQLDHLIEKTEAIECLDWLDRIASDFMDLLGVSKWIKELFFGDTLECQTEKDEKLEKLKAKKNVTEERIQKTHYSMKEVHPQKISQDALEKKLEAKLQDTLKKKDKMEMQQHLDKKE